MLNARPSSDPVHVEEGRFISDDGTALFTRSWMPNQYKAHIVILHGFGEHSGRHDRVAQTFAKHDYAVHSYDQRNHGHSPGKKRTLKNWGVQQSDLRLYLEQFQHTHSKHPHFIIGHSLGGLLLAHHAAHETLYASGIIFSSAGLILGKSVPPWLLKISALLGTISPFLPVHKVNTDFISRDPVEVKRYEDDSLNFHGTINAGTGMKIAQATQQLTPCFSDIDAPMLILHGEADQITDPEGSRLLYQQSPSTDKMLNLYPGAYHEMFNDLNKDEVIKDILDWLDKRSH